MTLISIHFSNFESRSAVLRLRSMSVFAALKHINFSFAYLLFGNKIKSGLWFLNNLAVIRFGERISKLYVVRVKLYSMDTVLSETARLVIEFFIKNSANLYLEINFI